MLPVGFRVQIDPRVRLTDSGRTLIGGSPMRVLRLRPGCPPLAANQVIVVDDPASGQLVERLLRAGMALPVIERAIQPAAVTVVIPVRDRPAMLDRLLTALGDMDVVVVDDASTRPERIAAVAQRHGARLVPLLRNVGPAAARNIGIAETTTQFVAFVDSDVVVEGRVITALLAHFDDPELAAVAPRIRSLDNGSHSGASRWEREVPSLDLGPHSGPVRPWSAIGWVPSACVVVRRNDLSGGFADRRVAEDVDLVWRLLASGRQVRYDASLVAFHEARATRCAWLARKAFYGTGGAWLAREHGGWAAPAVFSPVTAAMAAAAVVGRWWSLPVVVAGALLTRAHLQRTLGDTPEKRRLAWLLVGRSLISTGRQIRQLALRHWWPVTAVAVLGSRRTRRVVGVAAMVDLVAHADPDPARTLHRFAIRRLDDLAYGAGLWFGAARLGSARVLMPELTGVRGRGGAG